MFALEIDFRDGISPAETILVRRSQAIVGNSDMAHVVVEGAASSMCELRLVRGLGREIGCFPVRRPGQTQVPAPFLEGTYSDEATVSLGDLNFHITALDIDLMVAPDEFPDRAALRALRRAMQQPSPVFPALAVLGSKPIFISFPADESLLIGRSRKCGVRLDASDVSSEHARVGLDSEGFWVEDLGSTNGTFVGEQRISGRRYLRFNERIFVGSEFILAPVLADGDVSLLRSSSQVLPESGVRSGYPCLIARQGTIRPSTLELKPRLMVRGGRDPANEIWINAPHISRSHFEVMWDGSDRVSVTDHSSNGTYVNGERLERGIGIDLGRSLHLIDLCSGVEIGLCFSEKDKKVFLGEEIESAEEREIANNITREFEPTGNSAFNDLGTGILPELNDAEYSNPPPAFQRLMERNQNPAQEFAVHASEEQNEYTVENAAERLGLELGSNPGADGAFEQFQAEQRSKPTSELDFDSEFDLFSEAEFDEDLLEPASAGWKKLLPMALVVLLVFVVLFIFMGIFGSNYL